MIGRIRTRTALVFAGWLAAGAGAALAADLDIEMDASTVSFEARGADLRDVLEALAERVPFELAMDQAIGSEPVDMTARSEAVETVLRRLLAGRNHILVAEVGIGSPRIRRVIVLPRGADAPSPVASGLPAPAAASSLRPGRGSDPGDRAQQLIDRLKASVDAQATSAGATPGVPGAPPAPEPSPAPLEFIEQMRRAPPAPGTTVGSEDALDPAVTIPRALRDVIEKADRDR